MGTSFGEIKGQFCQPRRWTSTVFWKFSIFDCKMSSSSSEEREGLVVGEERVVKPSRDPGAEVSNRRAIETLLLV